jgi:hypothetical protein
MVDDRAADAQGIAGIFPAQSHPARNQFAVRPLQHDEAAIGLNEDLKQALEQLRKHVVKRQGPA